MESSLFLFLQKFYIVPLEDFLPMSAPSPTHSCTVPSKGWGATEQSAPVRVRRSATGRLFQVTEPAATFYLLCCL